MSGDIFFMPLGGGQRVGASCYYLRLGEENIILDAGIGMEDGLVFEPDLHSLKTSPFLQSLSQVSRVFISHAHADHVGYLLKLIKEASKASVYMTELTGLLSEYQLYDKRYMSGGRRTEEERLAAQLIMDRVVNVTYMQSMDFGSYQVTFLPAGHIPGAMMTLFEYGRRRILYTGDYSISGSPLTGGCVLPADKDIDTLILCGLHAKHPGYAKRADGSYRLIARIYRAVACGRSVMCQVAQLSKGIEFIKMLNNCNYNHVPIYIDDSIMPVVQKMEQLSIPILSADDHVLGGKWPKQSHVFITARNGLPKAGFYECVKVDFSLHEDFLEMKEFIKKINPKQAFLVHCAKEYSAYDETIEQVAMKDGECRTQFTFAEEREIYKL